MKTGNPIKFGIDEALNPAHFQRKSSTWYRYLDETILVVNLQKSNFGKQYYINLGIFAKDLRGDPDDKRDPKESDCHIRIRLDALEPADQDRLRLLLNLEDNSIDAAERQQGIAIAVARTALPFLIQCSTRQSIRYADSIGKLSGAIVHKSIREKD
ncbi:MAG: DUF4304 domain-containing protein [Alphaproteobacteria bacterium]|nr:DUF4304 domain-containing protein [Alphaproteobacteria bacterium]